METMKPDAPKNGNKQPQEQAKPDGGIPVYELRFCVVGGRDLPYVDANGGTGTLRAKQGLEITYFPNKRHHRVVRKHLDTQIGTKTFWVHESWCSFEPMPDGQ